MSSPQAQVFGVSELVEEILSHLPPRDLLLSQRVSRTFHAVIKSSPRLQQTLFFRPAPPKSPGIRTRNPLLLKPFLPWFAILCDLRLFPDYHTFNILDWNSDEQKRAAFLHPKSSWRRMLFIQPPPKELLISEVRRWEGSNFPRYATASFDDHESNGVTMGSLYDLSLDFVSRHGMSQFTVGFRAHHEALLVELLLIFEHPQQVEYRAADPPSRGADLMSRAKNVRKLDNLDLNTVTIPPWGWPNDMLFTNGAVTNSEFESWKNKREWASFLMPYV